MKSVPKYFISENNMFYLSALNNERSTVCRPAADVDFSIVFIVSFRTSLQNIKSRIFTSFWNSVSFV